MVKIKKLLSAVLMAVLICIASGMAVTASAARTITPTQPAGEGTSSSPYQISNAGELYWFAGLVNGDASVCDYDAETNLTGIKQNTAANAVVTASFSVNDGVLNEKGDLNSANADSFITWTPIGQKSPYYTGTFDGQGHTIGGLYINDNSMGGKAGLFACNLGTISNLGLIDSYFSVSTSDGEAGGLCSRNGGYIKNCYSIAYVRGTKCGGLYCRDTIFSSGLDYDGTVENCYSISNASFCFDITIKYGERINCYYRADTETEPGDGVITKTDDQFQSGEVAYLLQGFQIDEIWGQTLSGDNKQKYPVLGGAKVYKSVCGNKYANTQFTDTHSGYDKNGFCTGENCGAYQPAVLTSNKYDVNNDGVKDDVYEISNSGQLYWFAGLVNGTLTDGTPQNSAANGAIVGTVVINEVDDQEPFPDKVTYDSDPDQMKIDQELKKWTPIGVDAEHAYTGVFSGNGTFNSGNGSIYKVSGLYMNNASADYAGLFGYVGTGGKLENITLNDSFVYGKKYVGGICGYNDGGILRYCTNNSRVCVSYKEANLGGVCGYNAGEMNYCYNLAKKVAAHSRYYFYVSLGGLCGYNAGSITECENYNDILVDYDANFYATMIYAGGLVGRNKDGGTIVKSYNEGKVEYKPGTYIAKYGSNNGIWIGGFAGLNDKASIENCYNIGNVTLDATGLTRSSIENIYIGGFANTTDSTKSTKIENCYNFGSITADETEYYTLYIGGIYGIGYGNTITNSYYNSDLCDEDSIGFNKGNTTVKCGKTADQFASGEVAYLLNGSTSEGENLAWGQRLTGNSKDTYPVFDGSTVYQTIGCTAGYSNTENTEKEHEHNLANEYVCACGDKVTKLVVSTNETTVPELTQDTVLYEKGSTAASDFKYDGTSKITTVYVRIYNPTTDAKPVIKIAGDKGNVDSDTWTAATGKSIYCAQFIGDFADFGTIKVSYGSDTVTVPTTTSTEEEL